MKWIELSVEIVVGSAIFLEGLYLGFWPEEAKRIFTELLELPEDDLAIIGNIMGAMGLPLLYFGVRGILR